MIKLITLLVSLVLVGLIRSNPIPEDPSVDWSTRISDNVESIIGSTKFNFDDSSEEIDSTFAKREASPISGPLDAPLGWGARIESSPSAASSIDVSSSSSSGTGAVVAGGVEGGVGGDNKQKVDWALNPGDNKKLYSTADNPDVIEQKKEETLPLAPESSKPSEESNPDPYKNILPAVLTGKRRLAEGDKPVQSSPLSSASSEGDVSPSVKDSKEKVSPVSSLVDGKGQSTGQVFPYDKPFHLKPNDGKSIPQHVYTEDQFPSVITIKGREYLVIPHKTNTARPSTAQNSVGSPWYSIPVQGAIVQSDRFGSSYFTPSSPAHQPTQVGHGSKSNQSSPPVGPSSVDEVPNGGHHHLVSSFTGGYPGQSPYEFGRPSFSQHPGSSSFPWASRYPVYHSSVFTNPNVQQSKSSSATGQNSIPSVFSSFFPQYGPYPSSSSSPVIKNFEFFTPPSHTVSVSANGGSSTPQGDRVVVASPPSFITPSGQSVAASPQGEVKGNPTFVSDPSFSPKLQDSVHASPSVVGGGGGGSRGGVVINTQQESFVTKPIKPESNLHAPPQIPTWNPFGFSVVAGSYPVQSSSPSVAVSTSSSSVSSSIPLSSSSSKTHAESPVTVTVDTKFPSVQSPSSSSSSSGNNGVKGASPSSSVESSSPSVTVGSFNVDSAADQPVAKGQPQQTQQQDQQQVGVAGETLVPTTILDAKNQFIPNSPFLSSSGYFVSSPSINQVPSSVYSTPSSVPSSSPPSPDSIQPLGFPNQRHFLSQSWRSSGYNYPIPASPPSPYFDQANPVTPSWDYPFYHQFPHEGFYNQRGLDQPDFDLNQVSSAKIYRSPAFAA